ncbi:MAG: hypothetical protein WCK89_00685 [bacterium]
MKVRRAILMRYVLALCLGCALMMQAADAVIVVDSGASPHVQLAAREVRRYVYLRTGELLPVLSKADTRFDLIRVCKDTKLKAQDYRMKTEPRTGSRRTLTLAGGRDLAVLYAAYHFAEKLGVRFYLHGDVFPDKRIPFALPGLDETHSPLFETRGLLPFHDFTEGADWWEADDYKVCFNQMVKMRMNLLGLHCYPEGMAGPEPLIWIGHPDDVGAGGKVSFSSPSHWASTTYNSWGYAPMPTRDFAAGAASVFEEDDFGPQVTRGHRPEPKTPEACNEVFERAARLLRDVFGYGRQLGVKICIGTETPLHIPASVTARLREKGLDPLSPEVRQKVYEGMFTRIARTYPIDTYWLWTPEDWTWREATQPEIDATVQDVKIAMEALKKLGSPFGFGTCGWELGPKQDRGLFNNLLPGDAVMSCINRNIGFNWVDPEFVRIKGRPKWAIPWMEDDSAMVLPQLWSGRMRRDAADALSYGGSGLLGIHWRTKLLSPTVSALAMSAWSQKSWNPDVGKPADSPDVAAAAAGVKRKRDLPCADFYADMAPAWFGTEVAAEMAGFFTRYDGDNGAYDVIQGRATLPRPTTWLYGPGALVEIRAPWEQESKRYAFVDELAALRGRVKGPGNLERFDYWLNSFRYMRALTEAACARGALDIAMEQVKAEKDAVRKKALARAEAFPARVHLARAWETMMTYLLAATDTPGELGTIANLEQCTRLKRNFVDGHDQELADLLGAPLGDTSKVSSRYQGVPRIIVPTVRTHVAEGEVLTLKVILLDKQPMKKGALYVRGMGKGDYVKVELKPLARAVYQAMLPPARGDFEYTIEAEKANGGKLVWPATAPAIGQTVVVCGTVAGKN